MALDTQTSVTTLRDSGLVVLENALTSAFVAELAAAYDRLLEAHIAAQGGLAALDGRTFGKNQIGVPLSLSGVFADEALVTNPRVLPILQTALGAHFACSYCSSNTAYPGSETQPIHRDVGPLFGSHELSVPTPATHIVLNVPLCDFTEENGSTEVWPGTHLIVDAPKADGQPDLPARAAAMPSVRTNVKAGSLVLRDLRVWHRGMPNRSDHARPMLALVYVRDWIVQEPTSIPQATWENWSDTARHIFRRNPRIAT